MSTCGDSAAVAYGNPLLVAVSDTPALATLPSGINSPASDGRSFYAGTYANGDCHAYDDSRANGYAHTIRHTGGYPNSNRDDHVNSDGNTDRYAYTNNDRNSDKQ